MAKTFSKLPWFALSLIVFAFFQIAQAADTVPDCMDGNRALPIDNQQVIEWKFNTKNAYKDRAHVQGTVVRIFPDKTGHLHFEIQIGNRRDDTIEVIYNKSFGSTPELREGQIVQACGDYITSNAPNGGYQASPSGAIIHWVHRSNDLRDHETGFMVIDGVLCGMGTGDKGHGRAGRRQPRYQKRPHEFELNLVSGF